MEFLQKRLFLFYILGYGSPLSGRTLLPFKFETAMLTAFD